MSSESRLRAADQALALVAETVGVDPASHGNRVDLGRALADRVADLRDASAALDHLNEVTARPDARFWRRADCTLVAWSEEAWCEDGSSPLTRPVPEDAVELVPANEWTERDVDRVAAVMWFAAEDIRQSVPGATDGREWERLRHDRPGYVAQWQEYARMAVAALPAEFDEKSRGPAYRRGRADGRLEERAGVPEPVDVVVQRIETALAGTIDDRTVVRRTAGDLLDLAQRTLLGEVDAYPFPPVWTAGTLGLTGNEEGEDAASWSPGDGAAPATGGERAPGPSGSGLVGPPAPEGEHGDACEVDGPHEPRAHRFDEDFFPIEWRCRVCGVSTPGPSS